MFDVVLITATLPSSPLQILMQKLIMEQNTQKLPLSLSVSLLEVYESPIPPPGASINYPVGHAVVRLRLENLTSNKVNFSIRKIEIRQSNNDMILISQEVEPFNLYGLQILERGFHLTNRQGFRGSQKVKAVVTYQLGGKSYSAESPVSEILVHP